MYKTVICFTGKPAESDRVQLACFTIISICLQDT